MPAVGTSLLIIASILGDLRPDFVELFQATQSEVPLAGKSCKVHYRLFAPKAEFSAGEKAPLLVWLHGYGEGGSDNVNQLKWLDVLVFKQPYQPQRFPFFVLAVQCPAEMKHWTDPNKRSGHDMLDITQAVIGQLLVEQPIDSARVYLAGLSDGGSACWEMAIRYPELFAAVAPLASGGARSGGVRKLKDIPIWAFHSRDDRWSDVRHVRSTVGRLLKHGGHVRLTEIDSAAHDCWSVAFNEYGLLDWLLTQRQGQNSWIHQPGRIGISFKLKRFIAGWSWWHVVFELFMLTVFTISFVKLVLRLWWVIAHRGS